MVSASAAWMPPKCSAGCAEQRQESGAAAQAEQRRAAAQRAGEAGGLPSVRPPAAPQGSAGIGSGRRQQPKRPDAMRSRSSGGAMHRVEREAERPLQRARKPAAEAWKRERWHAMRLPLLFPPSAEYSPEQRARSALARERKRGGVAEGGKRRGREAMACSQRGASSFGHDARSERKRLKYASVASEFGRGAGGRWSRCTRCAAVASASFDRVTGACAKVVRAVFARAPSISRRCWLAEAASRRRRGRSVAWPRRLRGGRLAAMDSWYLLDEALEHALSSAEDAMVAAAAGLVAASAEDRRAAAAHWRDWEHRIVGYQLRLSGVRRKIAWALRWCTE